MPPKALPVPADVLEHTLLATPLSGQDIRALLRCDEFNALDCRNAQLLFVDEFSRSECGIPLDTGHLSEAFGVTRERVRKILYKLRLGRKSPHRPLSLSFEQEERACEFIREGSNTRNFVTQRDLLNFVQEEFHVTLTHGWINSFLSRRSADVAKAVVSPHELPRLQIPRRHLDAYINLIKSYIPLVPSELVFNLDETGLSDWEERRPKPVLIRADLANQSLHYPVDRAIRHQTLLCCISASGDAYCPLLLSANAAATAIFEKGVRENIDLQVKILNSPYVTREVFLDYIRGVFIPAVESNRSMPGCQNKPAILFCDNCACHCSDDVMRELAERGILLITYPPHTSHIFQVLDTLLFGRLKAAKKHILRDLSLGRDLDHVLRTFRAYELATTSLTIRSSWEKAGFGFHKRDGTWYLYVNEGKIRASPEFAEVWALDFPEESLSLRRRRQTWGWLNRQFFRVEDLNAIQG